MCGICGFFGPEDVKLLKCMNDVLFHRGPDDAGFYSDSLCSLGMRRLSIIDVAKGHQPVHNEDGTVWVVFNGEIYNYLDLRKRLSRHRFYTGSDTESIVHAYEEFGDDFVRELNGMFAFALWDSKRKRLLLARDRFGEKPLYYAFVGESLFFASEVKSILQNKNFKRAVNFHALHDYLSFRCNSSFETFFRGVFKLPPAHYLVYDGKSVLMERYWKPSVKPDFSGSEGYFSALVFEALKRSVRMRLMSEVPLGAYLSGGIDSGTVVGLMSLFSSEPVKTFSVGFGHDFDELKEARFLADHFKTDHREVIVKPDAFNLLPKVVWHLDEPMADPTCIPVYLLSKEIKPYASVVLTGDGSDELFYGYEQFRLMDLHRRFASRVPAYLRRHFASAVKVLPKSFLDVFFRYSSALGEKGMERLQFFLGADDPVRMYLSLVSIFSEDEKRALYSELVSQEAKGFDTAGEISKDYFLGDYDFVDEVARLDIDKILCENMLMRSDKNTMAFSVEQRVPFLDHELAELLMSIPSGLKLHGNVDKYILRKAVSGFVPKQTIRRRKSRFFVPIHDWLGGELGEVSRQMLEDSPFFSKSYVDSIFSGFKKSRLYYARQLWSLMIFSVWHKIFIERQDSQLPSLSLKGFV